MPVETFGGPTYEDRIRAAERERCAKIADKVADEAEEQIRLNNAYMERAGLRDQTSNDLCRHKLYAATSIATAIRNLKSE